MRADIPNRHIPVKYTYSHVEFGARADDGKLGGMNNVAAIRKAKKLSQSDLAEM